MNEKQKRQYPTLARLVAARLIAVTDDGEIIGDAADGVIVSIGNVHQLAQAAQYLATHPTPDTW